MTLNTTYSPAVADGNGVTKQFSYSFNPISINYLKVSLEISGQWVQQLSGWTATVSENGGIVTFDTAPTTRVAIERDVPEEQPTSYETSSGFQAKVIEHSFDMLTGMVQELKEKSDRSVSVEVGSPISPEQVVQQIERVYTSIDNVDAVADDLTNVDNVASDLTNINKVAGSITNVNKVGNSITKVNTVAGSIAKVGTVADNISDVNAVGGDITKVKAVADDLTNVDKVANNKTNINKVASIDSDVSAVAGIKNAVSTVSGISGNVTSVANNSTNVTTVATNISNVNKVGNAVSNVNKVGNNIADVNDVADDLANIDIVAGDIADVSAVGGNILNVTAVANDLTNIDAVAGNRTNIDTIATNNTNVSRVGSNINNVNSVANNETNINTVVSNLSDVTNVASYIGNIVTVSSGMNEVQAVAGDLSNIDGVSQYLGQIENVSDNITNVNAVGSNISNVNTVAGDHANIQTVVNNMTAINNAPTYANNSKIWAEGLDGEVAPLGGTHSSKGWAEIAEQAASGVQNPANRDLSNLTNTGQMIIDSQNGTISNCILEIPQNIKLELSNNVLTLKSGSVLALTGSSTYTTITITSDKTKDFSSYQDGDIVVFANSVGRLGQDGLLNRIGSGNTLPSDSSTYSWYYLTTDYNIYHWENSTWTKKTATYPLCILHKSENTVTFAKDSHGNDMIFNGAGFIGNTIFIYPNVKALVSNRYNTDGSLNNISITNDRLFIINWGDGSETSDLYLFADNEFNINRCFTRNYFEQEETPTPLSNLSFWRSNKQNITQKASSGVWGENWVMIAKYRRENNKIVSITPRVPVCLTTTEMLDKVQDQVDSKQDTLVSGTNIKTINSTTVLGSGNFTLADQSLSNLDSTGQMIVDTQNGTISNCILEIPQNLKCELSGATYTLKAGSIRTKFGSTYATITTGSDITVTLNVSTDGRFVMIGSTGTEYQIAIGKISSGATTPSSKTTDYFWNTTDLLMYRWVDASSEYQAFTTWCYPSCLIDVVGGVASFVKDSDGNDMIFNGTGFIGHHAFVYPNVRGLISQEKDTNGSLKSINQKLQGLYIAELNTTNNVLMITSYASHFAHSNYGGEVDSMDELPNLPPLYYVKNINRIIKGSNKNTYNGVILADCTYDGTTVTDFTIRQPYEGARNLLTDDIEEQVEQNTADIATKAGLSSNNTFTGMNTFSGDSGEKLTVQHTVISKGTNPQTLYGSTFIRNVDANGGMLGSLYNRIDTSGNVRLALVSYSFNGNTNSQLAICYDADGTTYAIAPTPAISDDSNKIATTEWFNDKLVLVNELPANPDSNVWYAIPEEE